MYAWVLVMIIFGTTANPSGISHMEVLKTYQIQRNCSEAIAKALSIRMPVAREFRCLEYKPMKHRKATHSFENK